ncbi:MAG: hypothetical protein IT425_11220 [Pirellulales bacterium]|nr:hypothetical protein [Pirellulales bacterium]
MISRTIDARSPFPVGAGILLAIAAALAAWGAVIAQPHVIIFAALPFIVGLCWWWGMPRPQVLIVEHDGLQLFGTMKKVLFSEVADVYVKGHPLERGKSIGNSGRGPVEVIHPAGCLVVPISDPTARDEFCQFLVAKVAPRKARPIPASLADYAEQQVKKFGNEKVHVTCTREMIGEHWRKRQKFWICLGILFTGVAWFAAGIIASELTPLNDSYVVWLGLGLAALILGGLAFLAKSSGSISRAATNLKRNPNSCIIITPQGLAMVQGKLQGSMSWREITGVTTKMSQFLRTSRIEGVQIRIRGGEIIAFDIYERSPTELESLIRAHLEPAIVPV